MLYTPNSALNTLYTVCCLLTTVRCYLTLQFSFFILHFALIMTLDP